MNSIFIITFLTCIFSRLVSSYFEGLDVQLLFHPKKETSTNGSEELRSCNIAAVYIPTLQKSIDVRETSEFVFQEEVQKAMKIHSGPCLYQQIKLQNGLLLTLTQYPTSVSGVIITETNVFMAHNASLSDIIHFERYNHVAAKSLIRHCNVGIKEAAVRKKSARFNPMRINPMRKEFHIFNPSIPNYYVETYVITDAEFNKKRAANATNHLLEILNLVNALYRPLNVHVVVVKLERWTSDKFEVTNDPNVLLDNLGKYRQKLITLHDNIQMINGGKFETTDGDLVGLAHLVGMCHFSKSAAITSDENSTFPLQTAATLAHEMGHNFGLNHDDSCNCPTSFGCLMAASDTGDPSKVPTVWSTCSKNEMQSFFDKGVTNYCLRNVPSPNNIQLSPSCGNGIVEASEQCDPGPLVDSGTSCCNVRTCQFTLGSVCASGPCCNKATCKFISKGTICRPSGDECDLQEYCNGTSELCPSDSFKLDGTLCDESFGTCYNGECGSRDLRCSILFGNQSFSASESCYYRNTRGDTTGYCSSRLVDDNFEYQACTTENSMCGLLHCEGLGVFNPAWPLEIDSYSGRVDGSICTRSVYSVYLTGMRDPTMVPNGSPCGDNKVCVNSQCMTLSQLPSLCNCSGRGWCNNYKRCHCIQGYSGTFCESLGCGGSPDSGPVCPPGKTVLEPTTFPSPPPSGSRDRSYPNVLLICILASLSLLIVLGIISICVICHSYRSVRPL